MFIDDLKESISLNESILGDGDFHAAFAAALSLLHRCLLGGDKLLIAGNGGSAADAQHFAAELVGRYRRERRGYAALALTTDSSVLTAWSNDVGFDTVFSRQIEALGGKGDILILISTSGRSKNLLAAAQTAKVMGIKVIGFLGKGGGPLKPLVDVACVVPSDSTPRIQEAHTLLVHSICEELERILP